MLFRSSKFVLSKEDDTYDLMQTVIGQGKTQITPLHLNLITNAIANDGIVMKPYVIDHIENYKGTTIKRYSAESYKKILTSEEAVEIKELMEGVVNNGTATRLKGLSYSAAGKTGSAEFSGVKEDSHACMKGQ